MNNSSFSFSVLYLPISFIPIPLRPKLFFLYLFPDKNIIFFAKSKILILSPISKQKIFASTFFNVFEKRTNFTASEIDIK